MKPKYFSEARMLSLACDGPVPVVEKVGSSTNLAAILRDVWPSDMDIRETFAAVYMNRRNKPLAWFIVSIGGAAETVVDPKMVFAPALTLAGCTTLAIAHNHPSGNLEPSDPDKALTKRIKAGAEVLGFTLLDHIIITPGDRYFSFADEGIL